MVRFADLSIDVSVQLACMRVRVRDVLALEPDAVVRLDRSAGENVDLLLGGMRAATGEVVVLDELIGLRITELRRDRDEET